MVENRDFSYPSHSTLPLGGGGSRRNAFPFGTEKYNDVPIPDVEKTLIIHLAVSTEYWRVTDGQTDKHLTTA